MQSVDLHRGYALTPQTIGIGLSRHIANDNGEARGVIPSVGGSFEQRGLARAGRREQPHTEDSGNCKGLARRIRQRIVVRQYRAR